MQSNFITYIGIRLHVQRTNISDIVAVVLLNWKGNFFNRASAMLKTNYFFPI